MMATTAGPRLGPFRNEAELSKELVLLERHVPIEMPELEDLATGTEIPLETIDYFQKKGFSTLLKRMENSQSAKTGEVGGKEHGPESKKKSGAEPEGPRNIQGRMF